MQSRAWREGLFNFLFPQEMTRWLFALRLGLGLQITFYSVSLRGDWNHLFAANGVGLISRDLSEAIVNVQSPLVPRLGWLVTVGNQLGFDEQTMLSLAWAALLCSGGLLLAGLFSRGAAITAWLLHLCAFNSGGLLSYGMDNFTTIGLFYLMLSPLPDRYSLDWRIQKPAPKDSQLLGFWRRVLQLHLCVIYFSGGITKCIGLGWWNGTSIWRALTRPPFNAISSEMLVSWKALLPLLGISVCLLETGYPIFIWLKRTRFVWLVAIIAMHVAIGVTMGMYLFALIMIILNVAAFEPRSRGGHYERVDDSREEGSL